MLAPFRPPGRLWNASSRLQSELANLEAIAAHHRADYERERDRVDRRVTELLDATANTTKELAVTLELHRGRRK